MRKRIDWTTVGDNVCEVLTTIYVDQSEQFRKEAVRRGISLEHLASAAITGMMQETAVETPRLHKRRLNTK